jgi:hypothetical protein
MEGKDSGSPFTHLYDTTVISPSPYPLRGGQFLGESPGTSDATIGNETLQQFLERQDGNLPTH